MIQLYENMDHDSAELCGLILRSSNIPFRIRRQGRGWGIWVQARDYSRAKDAVKHYYLENQGPEFDADMQEPAQAHGYSGVWAAVLQAFVYASVSRTGDVHSVWSKFGASAWRIMDGEVYRAVTALFLHADSVHLLGNMAGLAVFATAVGHAAGWGAGILMVLFSGVAGNILNAWIYESGHLSIGASTAVFGAIGILSGYQFLRRRKNIRQKAAAWLPVACGLALLGFLGTGAHVDLTAHLFGFLFGIVAGIGYAMLNRTIGARGQRLCLGAAAGVVLWAWAAGMWMH